VPELTAFWKTASFRLTVIVAASVSLAAILLVGTIYWQVNTALTRDIANQLRTEAKQLADYAQHTTQDKLIRHIDTLSQLDTRRLYFLNGAKGSAQAGNLDGWPASVEHIGKIAVFRIVDKNGHGRLVIGLASRLPQGQRLLVAREARLISDIGGYLAWWILIGTTAIALIGVLLGFIISRSVLGRITLITLTGQRIMSGDLSERIPISGTADEFDDLAANLNVMLDRIEELMGGIQEVSDNIAHDLKTPLNRLRNRAEDALSGALNERESLEHILLEADELIRTFNALLQIARLEAGASDHTRTQINLAEFVRDIVELYAPAAEDADTSIAYEYLGPVQFEGNRQLLAQALTNLIENALKYGCPTEEKAVKEKGAEIRVHLAHDCDHIALSVSDRGPGIPADQYDHALKRFGRLDVSRSKPGTGLGLSLVRAVAKIHNGHLDLTDNGPGLIATMRLPLTGVKAADVPQ